MWWGFSVLLYLVDSKCLAKLVGIHLKYVFTLCLVLLFCFVLFLIWLWHNLAEFLKDKTWYFKLVNCCKKESWIFFFLLEVRHYVCQNSLNFLFCDPILLKVVFSGFFPVLIIRFSSILTGFSDSEANFIHTSTLIEQKRPSNMLQTFGSYTE